MPNKCDKNSSVSNAQAQPYHTPPYFDWWLLALWHSTIKASGGAFGNIAKTVFQHIKIDWLESRKKRVSENLWVENRVQELLFTVKSKNVVMCEIIRYGIQ